jgi:hypothetical protein
VGVLDSTCTAPHQRDAASAVGRGQERGQQVALGRRGVFRHVTFTQVHKLLEEGKVLSLFTTARRSLLRFVLRGKVGVGRRKSGNSGANLNPHDIGLPRTAPLLPMRSQTTSEETTTPHLPKQKTKTQLSQKDWQFILDNTLARRRKRSGGGGERGGEDDAPCSATGG